MQEKYAQLALENTVRLLGIDSPSGYTENAAKYVQAQFAQMGYDAKITRKGGVLIDLGGEDAQDALLLEAHTDTLGGMVAQIKGNGRLRITNVGGMNANNAEAENVRVITKFSGAIDGTVQLCDASVHVNGNYSTTPRTFDTVEVCWTRTSARRRMFASSASMWAISSALTRAAASPKAGTSRAASWMTSCLSASCRRSRSI